MSRHVTTRRNVLKLAGLSAATVGPGGLAGASAAGHVEVNVGFHNDAGKTAAHNAASEVNREFDSLDAMTLELPASAVENLSNDANVRYVEENGAVETADDIGTLDDDYPWGVERIDADTAHAHGYTGAGTDVSIISTGIDYTHPDLALNVGGGECFVSCSGGGCSTCWDDDQGQGTRVAGTVAASQSGGNVVGVAHEATLWAVKVLDSMGAGTFSDVAAGIEWAADQGHEVATLSLGAASHSQVIEDACQYAEWQGTLLVAAAGSDPASVGYPAAYPECIAVNATDRNDAAMHCSSSGPEIELAGPGDQIESTAAGGGTEVYNCTSAAAPHVAGVGALVMAEGLTASQARSRMQNTAEDIGLSPEEQGYGLVNAADAVDGL